MAEPKIRFKQDDGTSFPDWTKETVGTLFLKNKNKNKEGIISNVITNSAEYGLIPQRDFFDKDIANTEKTENYTIISEGDFVYNPRKSSQAPFGPFNCYKIPECGIVSPLYTCLRPKHPEYTDYLLSYFHSPSWHRYIYNNGAQGGARHDRVGMTDDLMSGIPVGLPCLEEQQKIANFISDVDEVIAQSEAEVAALEKQKKGVMQKIFSQEVRFKKDDGSDYNNWEEKPLEEYFELVVDNRGKTPPISETGYPLIEISAVGDYNIRYGKIEKHVNQNTYDTWFRKHLKYGDILFSTVGNTAQCSFYDEKEKCCVAQNIVGLRFSDSIDNRFMFYLLTESSNNRKIKSIQMNGVQPSIKVTQFVKLLFSVPCLEEQQKIANFLSSFDEAIDLAKQELEKWKLLKKGLLQQMFV